MSNSRQEVANWDELRYGATGRAGGLGPKRESRPHRSRGKIGQQRTETKTTPNHREFLFSGKN